jgi:hypothetical protein
MHGQHRLRCQHAQNVDVAAVSRVISVCFGSPALTAPLTDSLLSATSAARRHVQRRLDHLPWAGAGRDRGRLHVLGVPRGDGLRGVAEPQHAFGSAAASLIAHAVVARSVALGTTVMMRCIVPCWVSGGSRGRGPVPRRSGRPAGRCARRWRGSPRGWGRRRRRRSCAPHR